MVVNSFSFLLFFIVVFTVYYLPLTKKNPRFQNFWLLLSSYFFYGMVDWMMVLLLIVATIAFYLLGLWLKIEMVKGQMKVASILTTFGVCLGIGLLLYFKYLNFFGESIVLLLSGLGLNSGWTSLNIIVPIGVSFFTFKLISYIIEIHREHIEASKDLVEFATYVAFFPTILSGPIDSPNTFLPQLRKSHTFDYALGVDGCRQILWGMFTKMCIADHLAPVVDTVWSDYASQSCLVLILATSLYSIQMYADFAGYSNMAIGVGKLLGFRITLNFTHPFIARNTAEYWRRWHMSLTTWITNYVFMPLNIAFARLADWGVILAVIINMVVIGLWHGANWTFALFGLYHGLLYIPLVLSGAFRKNKKHKPGKHGLPTLKDFSLMVLTFFLVAIGVAIFRAPTIADVWGYLSGILTLQNGFHLGIIGSMIFSEIEVYLFVVILLVLDWTTRTTEHPLQFSESGLFRYRFLRWSLYFVLLALIFIMTDTGSSQDFIYFQF